MQPTEADLKQKIDSGAMQFERETGCILNANTWKDRTTYYFCYPVEHFDRALKIEAERMRGVILTEAEFKPEQTNVLSEYDMYAGDEHFLLSVEMTWVAFLSHPYSTETIGFRNDIVALTPQKLREFYDVYYRPNNATLTIIGDIPFKKLEESVLKIFGPLEEGPDLGSRMYPIEPIQSGIRTVNVKMNSKTRMLGIGMKHDAFPSTSWFETMVIFDMLAGGKDSLLYKKFVDAGLAIVIDSSLEPTSNINLGIIYITLSEKTKHNIILENFFTLIQSLTLKDIEPYLKKTRAKILTEEVLHRESSLECTAELVEYISAGDWAAFYASETILNGITPKTIIERIKILCNKDSMTIGYLHE